MTHADFITAINAATGTSRRSFNCAASNVEATCTLTNHDWATIRPVKSKGSGRYTTNVDSTEATQRLLNALGLTFTVGNDAPRGGKLGDFIRLTDAAQAQIAGIRQQLQAAADLLAAERAIIRAQNDAIFEVRVEKATDWANNNPYIWAEWLEWGAAEPRTSKQRSSWWRAVAHRYQSAVEVVGRTLEFIFYEKYGAKS